MKFKHLSAPFTPSRSARPITRHSGFKRLREPLTPACAIKARWCIDIKYGVKMEAIALVQDWIQSVGKVAGLERGNTNLLSGAVGAAESRLELEVEFETLALLEEFWAAIPPTEHRAWSQRARNFIIDGSPRWEIYRTCSVFSSTKDQTDAVSATLKAWEAEAQPSQSAPKTASSILEEYLTKSTDQAAADLPTQPLTYPSLGSPSKPDSSGKRMAIDWKGDPMIINPGDNMPLF